jgi:hypothetical protein
LSLYVAARHTSTTLGGVLVIMSPSNAGGALSPPLVPPAPGVPTAP